MRIRSIAQALVILLCGALGASAQGIVGLNPTPVGLYQWNSSTNQAQPITNGYGSFALSSPPQPMMFYGWNASLGQWVPCTIQQPCLAASAAVTQIIAGTNITISPSGGTGAVTINAATGAGSPLTAKGDIYGYNTTNARIPVGADGAVLTAASAQALGVQWQLPAFQSLTTAGTSGPATLSGGVLNVPNYTGGGGGSGVQYPTYTYLMIGSSIQTRDDVHVLGQTITVTSGSCASGTCSIVNSGTNGLSVGDWVMVGSMTGFPTSTLGTYQIIGTNIDTFKVTAATATSFSFAYSGTATITGGSAYGYNFVTPYLTATKPYFSGHGTTETIGIFGPGGYGSCVDMNTYYSTTYGTYVTPSTMVIVTDCHNDFAAGVSAATIETALQGLAVKVHASGALLAIDSPSSDQFSCLACSTQEALFSDWLLTFKKSYNSPTGQYADFLVPMKSALNNSLDTGLFYNTVGFLAPGGTQRAADEYNNFMVTAGTAIDKDTPWAAWRETGSQNNIGYVIRPPVDSNSALTVMNAADSGAAFYVGTGTSAANPGHVYAQGDFHVLGSNNVTLDVEQNGTGGYLNIAQFEAPTLPPGWNGTNGNFLAQYFGVCNGTDGNCVQSTFGYVASGGATNEYDLGFQRSGVPAGSFFFKAMYNAGVPTVFLPSIAGASTYCLQISSTGQVTNTGAACGGGGAAFPYTIYQEYSMPYANNTTFTLTFPHALQASGATAFLVIAQDGSTSPTTPTGWTLDLSVGAGTSTAGLYIYQIASAGQTSVTWTASTEASDVYFVELGGTRTFGVSSVVAGSGVTNYIAYPSITPASGSAVFAFAAVQGGALNSYSNVQTAGPEPLDSRWRIMGVNNYSGGRTLTGLAYTLSSTGVAITPPGEGLVFYGGAPISYATFSIN